MREMMNWLAEEESGQGMTEYALIIALVAVLLITSLTALKDKIADVFNNISFEAPAGE